jgi:hypothetical protein
VLSRYTEGQAIARAIDWTRYDTLKAQGLADREIARRWDIPWGAFHREKQKREGPPAPVQRPVPALDTGAVHSADTGAVQTFDTGAVQRLDRLESELHGIRQVVKSLVDRLDHPPVPRPVQITALPPYPHGKAVRWNLWILDAIRDEIATLAAQRDISPSQLVQEMLWKALTDRRLAMPE